jgi:glycerol-3-phosphate acyltransferase PlsY
MSTGLLVALSVLEIVALVGVLALFVILITRRLRSLATLLGEVSLCVRAIQGDVCLVGAGAAILNRKLYTIGNALPAIAEKAESLTLQQR